MDELRILVSCFEPYDQYAANASQLAMRQAQEAPTPPGINVRWCEYPVDFQAVPALLREDLADRHAALLLGQAPGSPSLRLETRGVNERLGPHDTSPAPLLEDGQPEHHADLPLGQWVERLSLEGLPAEISHDAGRYLCNAVLYHALEQMYRESRPQQSLFLHIPLAPTQGEPNLPVEHSAAAITWLLSWMAELPRPHVA